MSQKPKNERHLIDWVVASLGVILAVLLFFFVRQYRTLQREEFIATHRAMTSALRNHPLLVANDADTIRSWMTFDYLNGFFKMPPDYLKNQLSISDPAYPKMTINKLAKDTHQNPSSTLVEVQNTVRQFFAPPSVPASSTSSL
jgi:hypothetical protein